MSRYTRSIRSAKRAELRSSSIRFSGGFQQVNLLMQDIAGSSGILDVQVGEVYWIEVSADGTERRVQADPSGISCEYKRFTVRVKFITPRTTVEDAVLPGIKGLRCCPRKIVVEPNGKGWFLREVRSDHSKVWRRNRTWPVLVK